MCKPALSPLALVMLQASPKAPHLGRGAGILTGSCHGPVVWKNTSPTPACAQAPPPGAGPHRMHRASPGVSAIRPPLPRGSGGLSSFRAPTRPWGRHPPPSLTRTKAGLAPGRHQDPDLEMRLGLNWEGVFRLPPWGHVWPVRVYGPQTQTQAAGAAPRARVSGQLSAGLGRASRLADG